MVPCNKHLNDIYSTVEIAENVVINQEFCKPNSTDIH